MRNDLLDQQLIPLQSPYLQHDVTLDALPKNITDWILLEIYADTSSTPVIVQSGLLKTDGTVIFAESLSPWLQVDVPQDTYFVEIHHRNHLSVTSPPILFDQEQITVDFTQQALLGQKAIISETDTTYVMQPGNADASDQQLNDDDLLFIKQKMLQGIHGYDSADVNLDGHVYASDYATAKEAMQ